jgi:hypothetical protein
LSNGPHADATSRPTSTDPVKKIFPIPGCVHIAEPISASPCSTVSSPAGSPAASNAFLIHSPINGVSGAGFKITAFPAASAIATSPAGIVNG